MGAVRWESVGAGAYGFGWSRTKVAFVDVIDMPVPPERSDAVDELAVVTGVADGHAFVFVPSSGYRWATGAGRAQGQGARSTFHPD